MRPNCVVTLEQKMPGDKYRHPSARMPSHDLHALHCNGHPTTAVHALTVLCHAIRVWSQLFPPTGNRFRSGTSRLDVPSSCLHFLAIELADILFQLAAGFTPAMQAGLTDHIWAIAELLAA